MHQTRSLRHCSIAVALAMALLAWPAASDAQLGGLLPPLPTPAPTPTTTSSTVVGQASAAQVSLLGLLGTPTTTALADTGTLSGVNDSRDASMVTGSTPVLAAETLSASTISWADQVDSQASLTNLNMAVAGISITADSVMAQASQVLGAGGSGSSTLSNLSINGIPVAVSGAPNQSVWIPGGQLIINEQTVSSTGTAVVNALHVAITGVADVVIASATAGIS
jgi:hypothetical protein